MVDHTMHPAICGICHIHCLYLIECLLQVILDIVNMLDTQGNSQRGWVHPSLALLLIG